MASTPSATAYTLYGPAPDNTSHTTAAAAAQATQTATPTAGEQLPGQAFQVEDLDPKLLPAGWHVDDEGYILYQPM